MGDHATGYAKPHGRMIKVVVHTCLQHLGCISESAYSFHLRTRLQPSMDSPLFVFIRDCTSAVLGIDDSSLQEVARVFEANRIKVHVKTDVYFTGTVHHDNLHESKGPRAVAHVKYDDICFEAGCDEVVKVLVKRVCNIAAKSTVAEKARSRSPREPEQLIPSVLAPPTEAMSTGPSGSLSATGLAAMSDRARAQWMETARVEAILGSCRHSLSSVRSGYRAYHAFASQCVNKLLQHGMKVCFRVAMLRCG